MAETPLPKWVTSFMDGSLVYIVLCSTFSIQWTLICPLPPFLKRLLFLFPVFFVRENGYVFSLSLRKKQKMHQRRVTTTSIYVIETSRLILGKLKSSILISQNGKKFFFTYVVEIVIIYGWIFDKKDCFVVIFHWVKKKPQF